MLGWMLFVTTAYRVANTAVENVIYDPFAVLGIKSVHTNLIVLNEGLYTLISFHYRVLRRKRSRNTTSVFPSNCLFLLPSS